MLRFPFANNRHLHCYCIKPKSNLLIFQIFNIVVLDPDLDLRFALRCKPDFEDSVQIELVTHSYLRCDKVNIIHVKSRSFFPQSDGTGIQMQDGTSSKRSQMDC